jgi:hypothetical protein
MYTQSIRVLAIHIAISKQRPCPAAVYFTPISYPYPRVKSVPLQTSEVICFCTNAESPPKMFYKVALILFLVPIYDGACNNFNIPSYIPNMIAALGTVLRR